MGLQKICPVEKSSNSTEMLSKTVRILDSKSHALNSTIMWWCATAMFPLLTEDFYQPPNRPRFINGGGYFCRSIRPVLIVGQMFGLLPLDGVWCGRWWSIHWKLLSWRNLYALFVQLGALIMACFSFATFWYSGVEFAKISTSWWRWLSGSSNLIWGDFCTLHSSVLVVLHSKPANINQLCGTCTQLATAYVLLGTAWAIPARSAETERCLPQKRTTGRVSGDSFAHQWTNWTCAFEAGWTAPGLPVSDPEPAGSTLQTSVSGNVLLRALQPIHWLFSTNDHVAAYGVLELCGSVLDIRQRRPPHELGAGERCDRKLRKAVPSRHLLEGPMQALPACTRFDTAR